MKIDKNFPINIKTRTAFRRAEQSLLSEYTCTWWAYELSLEDQEKPDWLADDPSNENRPMQDFLVSDIESVLGTNLFTD
jgi:hypothetical protein